MEDLTACVQEARRRARECGVAPHDADDVMQETLTRVWQRLRGAGRLRSGSLHALVRTVLKGLVVDRRRRARATETFEESAGCQGEIGAVERPEEILVRSERRAAVRRAIAALPPAQRDVVELRYFHGLKFKQIAAERGLPLNTVLARMHRAAGRLRGLLDEDDV